MSHDFRFISIRAIKMWGGKKVFAAIMGVLMGWLSPVYSANAAGALWVAQCTNCVTTSDFSSSAIAAASSRVALGTYLVISAGHPASALMRINGTLHLSGPLGAPGSHLILSNPTATPVDSSGNSLAGQSESQQEAVYSALDLTTFGIIRTTPIVMPPDASTQFGTQSTFPNSNDAITASSIDQWLSYNPTLAAEAHVPGGIVLVYFPDKTSATFLYNGAGTPKWLWNGMAWDKGGHQINKDGSSADHTNPPGSTGGGSATVPNPSNPQDIQIAGDVGCSAEVQDLIDVLSMLYRVTFFIPNC